MIAGEINLLSRIRSCRACEDHLPLGPRPIVQGLPSARLLIVGQAPGIKVHQTGIPWNDSSGDRLRQWLGISQKTFYDPALVALLPIGFCYPGRANSGDLPPRRECYKLWHRDFVSYLKETHLTLLVGNYAHDKYLKDATKVSGTETIRHWKEYLPQYIPLPHPSPRNNIWLHKNPWFTQTVIPELQSIVKGLNL